MIRQQQIKRNREMYLTVDTVALVDSNLSVNKLTTA